MKARAAGAVPTAEKIITRAALGSSAAVALAGVSAALIWRAQWASIAVGSGIVIGSFLLTWVMCQLGRCWLPGSTALVLAGSYLVKLAALLAIVATLRHNPHFDLYWIAGAFITAEILGLIVHTALILTARGPGLDDVTG